MSLHKYALTLVYTKKCIGAVQQTAGKTHLNTEARSGRTERSQATRWKSSPCSCSSSPLSIRSAADGPCCSANRAWSRSSVTRLTGRYIRAAGDSVGWLWGCPPPHTTSPQSWNGLGLEQTAIHGHNFCTYVRKEVLSKHCRNE